MNELEVRIINVAGALVGELRNRFELIGDLVNGGLKSGDEGFDEHVDTLVAQSALLCDALATELETGKSDEGRAHEFKTREELTSMLLRLAGAREGVYGAGVVRSWLEALEERADDEETRNESVQASESTCAEALGGHWLDRELVDPHDTDWLEMSPKERHLASARILVLPVPTLRTLRDVVTWLESVEAWSGVPGAISELLHQDEAARSFAQVITWDVGIALEVAAQALKEGVRPPLRAEFQNRHAASALRIVRELRPEDAISDEAAAELLNYVERCLGAEQAERVAS